MDRRDRSLEVILGQLGTRGRQLKQPGSFDLKLSIPKRTVLIEKRGQFARNVDARRQSRGVKTKKRGQRVSRGRRAERMFQQQRREPHRLMTEFGANRTFRGGSVIALIEK